MSAMKMRWVAVMAMAVGAAAGCGDNSAPSPNQPYFNWTGQRQVGSMSLDHLTAAGAGPLLDAFAPAADDASVVMVYAHAPGVTVEGATIEAALQRAQRDGLTFYTYADLAAGVSRGPGICLSFDDMAVDQWYTLRDLFAQYGAHASFFVTRYALFTDEGRAKLHQLYADGNSIEAHGIDHVDGKTYVAANGMAAYLADQVQPSFDILRADGFTPVAFAHPFGQHDAEIDAALEPIAAITRGISETPLLDQ
jgi:hypothetical protein